MRDVSLSAQKFDDDYADARAASARRPAAAFPPDFGPARHKERPALARFLRRPRLGVDGIRERLPLEQLGVRLTKLTPEQADYIGVKPEGPYKPEAYRY